MSSAASAVYKKELLEMSRDRRTLISMVVVPVVVFPLLFGVVAKFTKSRQQQAAGESATIGVHSAAAIPTIADALRAANLTFVDKPDLKRAVDQKQVAAALEESAAGNGERRIILYIDRSREASSIAADRVSAVLDKLKDDTIRARLRDVKVPENILRPFEVTRVNVAPEQRTAGAIFGGMLGYIVIILMFTGALYPAIDMTAGEKERRTLEVLLASPAKRTDILLGKILACATASIITAVLTMGSMVYSFRKGSLGSAMGNIHLSVEPSALALVLASVLPVALLAASVMVAIALFAKSYKEGQTYLTPLLLVVVFPAVLGMLPGLELTPVLALIPIFNVSQMVKGILQGSFSMTSFGVALAANLFYAAVAFVAATRLFNSEGVLFRSRS
jgi:sodium transport system permease protein